MGEDGGIILYNTAVLVKVNGKRIDFVTSVNTKTGEIRCVVSGKKKDKLEAFLKKNADRWEFKSMSMTGKAFFCTFWTHGKMIKLTIKEQQSENVKVIF